MSGKNILLGLGIGMVCSGMLLGLFNRRGLEISDAEIKRRAAELGMVEDNRDVILTPDLKDRDTEIDNEENSDFQKEETSNKEEEDNQNQELSENNEKNVNAEKEENTIKTQSQSEEKETKKKKKINSSEKEKDNSTTKKKDSNEEKSSTEDTIDIEIATGMTAEEICKELEEQGIIKNAVKFRNYISKKEMQRNLRAGTYQISKNAGYDEILEIICKG